MKNGGDRRITTLVQRIPQSRLLCRKNLDNR
jgi:hypothetical protein